MAVLCGLVTGLAGLIGVAPARAANETFVNENFTGSTTSSPNWVVPSTPSGTNQACLTAGTAGGKPVPGCSSATDSAGSGALRFTSPSNNQEGGLVYGLSIPTTDGLDATFDAYQYGHSGGADGISFFFAAENPADPKTPAAIGQPGGELGYSGTSTDPGLDYGYFGIGLDVYGNYANTAFEGSGCTDPAWDSAKTFPNNVSVRGPGNSTSGYCMLNSTAASGGLSSGTLDGGASGTRSSSKVPVEVVFNPTSSTMYTSSGLSVPAGDYEVAFTPIGGSLQTLSGALPNLNSSNPGSIPASWINPSTGIPYQVTFGWTGSTGGAVEYHEVNTVNLGTVTGIPGALTVGMSDNANGSPTQGSTLNYNVTVGNQSGSASDPGPIYVTDTVPSGETPSSTGLGTNGWTCSISGQQVSCSHTGTLAGGTTLPQLVIPVTVNSSAGTSLTNSAVASSDNSDPGSGQDTATVEPAPQNAIAPTIYGKAQDGQQLSASTGTWNDSPTSYAYQWYDCPGADGGTTVPTASCSAISGATGSTYTLAPADVGSALEVAVTATNQDGTSSPAISQATSQVTAGPAASVSVTLSPSTITANGTSQSTARAVVTDEWGVPVTGDTVAFSSSGAQGVGATSALGSGTYQATITSTTTAGSATITAVDQSMSRHPSGTAILTQQAGPAAHVALSLSPSSIVADGASGSTATATVTDAYGNPVSGDTVTIAAGGGQSVGTVTAGGSPGTYAATITSTTKAGASTVTATDTSVAAKPSQSQTLTQVAGKAAEVSVSLSRPSITADGVSQSVATATDTDVNGNPVSGDTVTIAGSGGQTVGSVAAGASPGSYVATITASTQAGASTVTATDTSASEHPVGVATLNQTAGPAAQVSLALSPASIVGNGTSSSTATATVSDAYGNPVSGDGVTIASDGGQAVGPVSAGSAPGTYVATITSTTTPGTASVTATDTSSAARPAQSQTLNQTVDRAAYVKVSLSRPSITADGVSQSVATATVTDQNGNPVAGDQVSFASDGGQAIGSVTDHGDGTYSAPVTATTTAGTSTITATDTSPSRQPSGSATLTQTAGPATTVGLTLSRGTLVADGVSSSVATVAVADTNGNPVSGDAVTIASDGGQAVSAVSPGSTPGTYIATITSTTTPGATTVTATDTSVSPHVTSSQPLSQLTGPGDDVDVTLSPASITADGTSTTQATARVTDVNGNPVSGDQVAFTSSGGQQIGSVSPGAAPGTYVATITATRTAGSATITATDSSVSGDPSGNTALTQTAGSPAHTSVSLSSASILANGQSTSQATITVTDAYGNPVSNYPVTLTSNGTQQLGPVTATGAPGTYSALITAGTTVGPFTITAHAGDAAGSITLTQSQTPQVPARPQPTQAAGTALPTIQIDTPADGGVYLLHQKIGAAYFCTDPLGATDILSCAGPNKLGRQIDTNELGTHAFAVTAVNRAGQVTRAMAHYVVVAAIPPARPLVYLAGPLSLNQGVVSVPIGCLSPVGRCWGQITLRMTIIGRSASGGVTYRYVNVGSRHYSVLSHHRHVARIALSQLGRESYSPGAPLPTIILGVRELGGAARRIVIN